MNRRFSFFLIVSFLIRIIYSLNVGLIDDEAYHWSWTKTLQLSYFDHPAMIAWLESISTAIFGDTLIGVRLPSFLLYVGVVYFSWKLSLDLFGEVAAKVVVLLILWTPLWGFGGYVASPETPFMFFWILSCWIFWQYVREDQKAWSAKKTWIYLGITMGLGLNSKFITALLAPGFGLYMLMSPKKKDLFTRWPWFGFLIATIICLPIFIWNQHMDWPGFKYQFHDRHTGETFSIVRWAGWWSAQWLFLTPVVYFMMVLTFVKAAFSRQQNNWKFIFALSLPTILTFYPQPLFADYKPHWPGAMYLILCLGIGALWKEGFTWHYKQLIKPRSRAVTWGTLSALIFLNFIIYAPFLYPWSPKVFRLLNPGTEWKTTYDLSNEFHGWLELGSAMKQKRREIHSETSRPPFLAALRYETTAQAWWGVKEPVFMLNTPRSHYSIMQEWENSLEALKGLDAVVVTTEKYSTNPMEDAVFDSCIPEEFKTYRADELARTFTLWWCKNFQGIKP